MFVSNAPGKFVVVARAHPRAEEAARFQQHHQHSSLIAALVDFSLYFFVANKYIYTRAKGMCARKALSLTLYSLVYVAREHPFSAQVKIQNAPTRVQPGGGYRLWRKSSCRLSLPILSFFLFLEDRKYASVYNKTTIYTYIGRLWLLKEREGKKGADGKRHFSYSSRSTMAFYLFYSVAHSSAF